ncbi:MAG TPA: hypothetical protein VGE26_03975 [Sphingobacteriaceae bacterium]
MNSDPLAEKLFEMKLIGIYEKYPWMHDEISMQDFIRLFPVIYKQGKPMELNKPAFELDKAVFLEVLVAFKQSFG